MRKILVVDDTTLDRESLARLLEYEGFETLRAANGKEGWAVLYNQTPDLILLDLMMPMMDGITFLTQLRKSALWKHLPVIVLTGASEDKKLVKQAWELQIKELIPKASFGVDELMEKVRQHLEGEGPSALEKEQQTSHH